MKWNKKQLHFLNEFEIFLKDPVKKVYTLTGGPGTGKTTVLQAAIPKYTRVVGATVSHAAKNILQKSLGVNVKCFTIASLLGLIMEVTSEGEITFIPDLKKQKDSLPIFHADLLIIDECSMINKEVHNMILTMSKPETKVVFVGDSNQLPSVGEETDSKALTYEGIELSEPMRFTGNIYKLTDAIRKEIEKVKRGIAPNRHAINYASNGRSKDMLDEDGVSGVRFMRDINKTMDIAVNIFKNSNNPNCLRLLAFKNVTIDALNSMIRRKLYGDNPKQFEKNELVISNGGYRSLFNNGEVFTIQKTLATTHRKIACFAVRLNIKTEEPVYVISSDPYDPGNILFNKTLNNIATQAKSTLDPWLRKKLWVQFYDFKMSFAKFDYAYAQNCYKSQGATYDDVIVFDQEIMNVKPLSICQKLQALYVSLTRAKRTLYIHNKNY